MIFHTASALGGGIRHIPRTEQQSYCGKRVRSVAKGEGGSVCLKCQKFYRARPNTRELAVEAKVISMRLQGDPLKLISYVTGRSVSGVWQILKRNGVIVKKDVARMEQV